jgi:uncharacterized repeat protein (TIGR04052 family)
MRVGAGLIAMAMLLAGCEPRETDVLITFRPVAQGALVACAAGGPALADLRFFVHNIALLRENGDAVPVQLAVEAPWQNERVALIDLEDGTGACATGSPARRAVISGRAPAAAYTGLRFTLGVPFALNHANPTLAAPPLDQSAMHWHWQAGYKYLRAGLQQDDMTTWIHLGSTGCRGRIGSISGCDRPNRAVITITGFDPTSDAVAVDLGRLFSNVAAGASCEAEPDNPACDAMYRALGLTAEAPQEVFRRVALH